MIQLLLPFAAHQHAHFIPLFNTETTRQVEAQALSNALPHETSLMQRAGHITARLAQACYPHAGNILIIAGTGNNGGDAIVAATHLKQMGKNVHLIWLGNAERASNDTLQAVQAAHHAQLTLHPYTPETLPHLPEQNFDLIIDGLFGIGLSVQKPLSEESIQLISFINQSYAPVIAIDIPSGLMVDTGVRHTHAVKADHTLTFLTAKPGLFTADGREYCGHIWLDNLQTAPSPLFIGACAYLYMPQKDTSTRPHNTHKGTFGDVGIIGGATGMTGAALLAGRAAIKAGAGRVYLSILDSEHHTAYLPVDLQCPELMFRPVNQLSFKQSTIACGCGGGVQIMGWLPQILHECPRLVLDADALNAIAASKDLQQQLSARKAMGLDTIITPHPLEAARLLKITSEEIQSNRLYFAGQLAKQFECTCILKGSGSITATPQQTQFINSSGNAALATAGSGDVLSGWIAGRWSATHQLKSALRTFNYNLHKLTAQWVWEHGNAADRWVSEGHCGAIPASSLIQWITAR